MGSEERKETGQEKRTPAQIRSTAWGCSLIVGALALLVCVLYWEFGRRVTTLNPETYTTLYRLEDGAVGASLNLSAMLEDLHLPDLRGKGTDAALYPDIEALENLQLSLAYGADGTYMEVSLAGNMEVLREYGIVLSPLIYKMETPAYVAPEPEEAFLFSNILSEAPQIIAEGYLTSLLDAYGRGYNLRAVCEEVQRRRDQMGASRFNTEYTAEKTQVSFAVFPKGGRLKNCYRAVYAMKEKEGEKSLYLIVEVQDLSYSAEKGVTFRKSTVTTAESLKAAEDLEGYVQEGCTCTVLYGGGMVHAGRELFDQNGFVRFYGKGTSYRLANGLYWSPTYDLLEEDSIWQLTAGDAHSLVNLLRYARKEIYARHQVRFDESTEREFYRHFTAYNWYEGVYAESEVTLSEAEKANVRLLREIQSLIEK